MKAVFHCIDYVPFQERKMVRTETDQGQRSDYDDDYLEPNALNRFMREGSKMSYHRKKEQSKSPKVPPVIETIKEPPPTRAEGFLARKQELESGGKRSTSRQWKTLYTVLCGQLLCFFKDKKTFLNNNSAKPPVSILKAQCYVPKDYHKKKYVIRLELSDRSAFLFEAPNDIKRQEWMQKINFTANLPPSKQLMSVAEDSQFMESAKENTINIGTVDELYSSPTNERLHEPSEDSRSRVSSDTPQNFSFTAVYDKPQHSDSYVNYGKDYNDFYDDPFDDTTGRTFSITSYEASEKDPVSARSSLSNQSSYVTGKFGKL